MPFIQIIDYETDRADEIDAAMRDALAESSDDRLHPAEQTQDHDNPRHFLTIVEFPSYELAMANSGRPRPTSWRASWPTVHRGPDCRNLDVQLQLP